MLTSNRADSENSNPINFLSCPECVRLATTLRKISVTLRAKIQQTKVCHVSFVDQKDDNSSIEKRRPVIGALKALDTPAAAPIQIKLCLLSNRSSFNSELVIYVSNIIILGADHNLIYLSLQSLYRQRLNPHLLFSLRWDLRNSQKVNVKWCYLKICMYNGYFIYAKTILFNMTILTY